MPKKIPTQDENEEEQSSQVVPETPKPTSVVAKSVEKSLKNKAQQMKEQLEAQPKVMIMIPLEKGERAGTEHPFCINGYKFKVPKGRMVSVPEQVAEMVAERFSVELDVRSRAIGQSDREKKSALDFE